MTPTRKQSTKSKIRHEESCGFYLYGPPAICGCKPESRRATNTRTSSALEHARNDTGVCLDACYACERAGLIARIKFTEDYETIKREFALVREAACDVTLLADLDEALKDADRKHFYPTGLLERCKAALGRA